MSTGKTPTVSLVSNDGTTIICGKLHQPYLHYVLTLPDRQTAERSLLIKNMLDDFGTEGTPEESVPVPNESRIRAAVSSASSFTSTNDMNRLTNLFFAKSQTGASTTATTNHRPTTTNLILAGRPRISTSGTRSLCRSTKRCSSRLSSPAITSISRHLHYCPLLCGEVCFIRRWWELMSQYHGDLLSVKLILVVNSSIVPAWRTMAAPINPRQSHNVFRSNP